MPAICLDGRVIARKCEDWLKSQIRYLKKRTNGATPCLATILVGDHKPSRTYISMKQNACTRVGIRFIARNLPEHITTIDLIAEIEELNHNPECNGILLQHPVPDHIDELRCFDVIALEKDVDGVTGMGYARIVRGQDAYLSATPRGILRLLEYYRLDVNGLDVVVAGRGIILGTPLAASFTRANATVTLCHSKTQNLRRHIERADMVVVGIGRPHFIPSEWIRDDAIAIDAGFNPGGIGDIRFDKDAYRRLKAYAPVPGGVGPMTVNTLLYQTFVSAYKTHLGDDPPNDIEHLR